MLDLYNCNFWLNFHSPWLCWSLYMWGNSTLSILAMNCYSGQCKWNSFLMKESYGDWYLWCLRLSFGYVAGHSICLLVFHLVAVRWTYSLIRNCIAVRLYVSVTACLVAWNLFKILSACLQFNCNSYLYNSHDSVLSL